MAEKVEKVETAIKLHLYIQGIVLTKEQAHMLVDIITQNATKAGVPMTYQIYDVDINKE